MQSYKKKSNYKNCILRFVFSAFFTTFAVVRIYNNITRIIITLLILTNSIYSWSNIVVYKHKGCNLAYTKIDEYNVEVAKQDEALTTEHIHIPSEISDNDTMYYVIGIQENAFSGNNKLKKITFDAACDIQYIGAGAFAGCQNLTEIELPSTITEIKPYTFAWCGLKYIEIHNFITKIGERAFTNCKKLSKIEMSENIEIIDNYAFAWCTSLTSFTIPEKTKHLGYEILQANNNLDTLFYNAINCKNSGAYYDDRVERTIGAFENNNGLSEVIFGYKVNHIPEYLLYNCHNVDSLYFPKSIKEIDRFALHNTEWFESQKSDMIYVNNIAYHYKGKKENLSYEDFKENVSSISAYCFYNNQNLKKIKLPSYILNIGNSAFENCKNLTEISLPYDLEQIGDNTFKNCQNLSTIHFNNMLEHIGQYCFSGCKQLAEVKLPHSIRTMGVATFYNCENLKQTNIPDSIQLVVAGCFSNCTNLEFVQLHNNIKSIEEYAFAGCSNLDSITIPRCCEKIGSRAFSHCSNLTQISLNAKSVRIDPLAFYKCHNLPYIDLLGANRIGYKAFSNCTNLSHITLGENIKYISDFAFEKCQSLFSIEIPQKVEYIGKYAFSDCTNLLTLKINNAKTNIGAYAFNRCKFLYKVSLGYNITHIGAYAFNECHKLESIEIKNPIEKIENYCFAKCYSLHTIKLPQGLTEIGTKAFFECKNLKEINLPNTVTTIKEKAFYNCNSLNELTLSNQITEIQENAFTKCNNLKHITLPITISKIGKNAFGECYNLTNVIYNAEKCYAGDPIFAYTKTPTNLTIGNTVQIIDDRIFEGMNLQEITIPQNVIKIGKLAFAESYPLTKIKLQSLHNIDIDNSAFNNTSWLNNQKDKIIYLDNIALKYRGEMSPEEIVFKEGTTAIASDFMKNNENLKYVYLPTSIEAIGCSAFENCNNLTNIEFPSNIKSIYTKAFAQCSKLSEIKLPSSISIIDDFAFQNCTNIDSINLNNAYCSIGIAAFRNCKKMITANIGINITEIKDMAFAYCTSLKNINSNNNIILPQNLQSINTATFFNCENLTGKIILPSKTKKIDELAFEGCKKIHSVEISKELDSISLSAFNKTYNFTRFIGSTNNKYSIYNGCLYSKNMSILHHCPKGFSGTYIAHREASIVNKHAFDNCTKIQYAILNNIEKIEDFAFNGCTKLQKITLGENFNSFNNNCFEGCQSLSHINIKKNNIHYKSVDGIIYSADMKTLIYCPRAKKGIFKIPKTVQFIADYAFYNCNQITKIIKHNKIKSIGKEAFTGCKIQ